MTVPTGAQISFGYTIFTDYGGNVNRWVTSMIKDGQTWTFTPVNQACSTPPCPMQVTLTTPAYNDGSTTAGDTRVYQFSVVNQGTASGSWNTQTQYFQRSFRQSSAHKERRLRNTGLLSRHARHWWTDV